MFRKLKRGEIKEVAKLLRTSWKLKGKKGSISDAETYVKKGHKIVKKEGQFFVLEERNTVIGIIAGLILEHNLAELRDLVVKEKYRGLGYGKQLITQALSYCEEQKVRKVYAYVGYEHEGLLRLFGFHVEGVLRNHFEEGQDLLIMSVFL